MRNAYQRHWIVIRGVIFLGVAIPAGLSRGADPGAMDIVIPNDVIIVGEQPIPEESPWRRVGPATPEHGLARPPVRPLPAQPARALMTIDIQAFIDGKDYLIIRGNTVQWRHEEWAIVGRHPGFNEPTVITAKAAETDEAVTTQWFPDWLDWRGKALGRRQCPAMSSVFTGLSPSLPTERVHVTLEPINCRGAVRIEQQPGPENNGTLIVEFNDSPLGGAFTYKLRLTVVASPGGPVQAGTVAQWRFDQGAPGSRPSKAIRDTTGRFQAAPVGGVAYRSVDGITGLAFGGSADRLFVADDPAFELSNALTLEALIRYDGLDPNNPQPGMIVFRGDDRGGHDPWFLAVGDDGLLFLHVGSNSGEMRLVSPHPLPVGQWVHVAGTFDGRAKLYINGRKVSEATTTVRPSAKLVATALPGIGIGNVQSGNYPYWWFNGMIAEVRVSNRVLEPNEFLPRPPSPEEQSATLRRR